MQEDSCCLLKYWNIEKILNSYFTMCDKTSVLPSWWGPPLLALGWLASLTSTWSCWAALQKHNRSGPWWSAGRPRVWSMTGPASEQSGATIYPAEHKWEKWQTAEKQTWLWSSHDCMYFYVWKLKKKKTKQAQAPPSPLILQCFRGYKWPAPPHHFCCQMLMCHTETSSIVMLWLPTFYSKDLVCLHLASSSRLQWSSAQTV